MGQGRGFTPRKSANATCRPSQHPPPLFVLESWMLDAHLRAFDLTCSVQAEIPVFWGDPAHFSVDCHLTFRGWGWGGWIWLSRNVMDILVWRPLLTERCSSDNKPCALWHFLPSKESGIFARSWLALRSSFPGIRQTLRICWLYPNNLLPS